MFTIQINSKLFLWPVHSVQETSPKFTRNLPKFSATLDAGWWHSR